MSYEDDFGLNISDHEEFCACGSVPELGTLPPRCTECLEGLCTNCLDAQGVEADHEYAELGLCQGCLDTYLSDPTTDAGEDGPWGGGFAGSH